MFQYMKRKLESNNNNHINKKKLVIELTVIIFLITTNFIISSYLGGSLLDVIFWSDDAFHINVAKNFSETGKFFVSFLPVYPEYTVSQLIETSPDVFFPENGYGPIYYVLLGSFFKLLQSTPEFFQQHAILLNTIVTSTSLILFFFLIKKNFKLKVAIFSSTIILLTPYFAGQSIIAVPSAFLFLFSIAALFFLKKKKSNYILFAIFAALAHLTHPLGILIPLSYVLFLLIEKNFRGFLIIITTWTIVLIPWFVRNYFYFGDIGVGLYLPFSEKVSPLFSFLPQSDKMFISGPNLAQSIVSVNQIHLDPYFVFKIMLNISGEGYHIFLLLIFTFVFAMFAFVDINKFKKNIKYLSFLAGLVVSYILVGIYINEFTSYLQIFMVFVLPIIIVFFAKKYHKSFFNNSLPRLHYFIILFSFLNLIASYAFSLIDSSYIESRFLPHMMLLLIPLSLVGFQKICKKFISYIKITKLKTAPIITIILILVLTPIVIQGVDGLQFQKNLFLTKLMHEEDDVKKINEFARNEIPQDSHVGSSQPFLSSMRTGLSSIILPINVDNPLEFDNYIKHYDISYLIFYNFPEGVRSWPHNYDDLYYNIIKGHPRNYTYLELSSFSKSHILRVEDVLDADISNQVAYLAKGVKLEEIGRINEANKIFDEIRNFQYESPQKEVDVCSSLTYYERYDDAINHCSLIIEKHNTNPVSLIAVQNIVVALVNSGQIEKHPDFYKIYDFLLENLSDKEIVLESWGKTINTLISYDGDYYRNVVNEIFIDAKDFEQQGQFEKALITYERIKYVDEYSLDSWKEKIKVLTKMGRYDDALTAYDVTLEKHQNKIKNLQSLGQHDKVLKIQKSMIEVMKGKATFLVNLEDFHKANRVYLEILGIDKFDPDVYKKIAAYHEKYEKLKQTLHNYEWALNLQPENDFLIEKIKELKDKTAD